jgi:hypothetical protein
MSTPSYGELEILPANRLTVLKRFQRTPKPPRIRWFQAHWNDELVGILLVAKITDGEYAGKRHVYDGGTRWAAMHGLDGTPGINPEYLFPCYVKEMTTVQAAESFMAENQTSMKPSAFARFRVGTAAGHADALALERALKAIPLMPDEGQSDYGTDEEMGHFSAFASGERIIKKAYAAFDDGEDGYDKASDHLVWVLRLTRRAWPGAGEKGAASAHDADMIQAVSAIGLRNEKVVGDEQWERDLVHGLTTWHPTGQTRVDGLFENGQAMRPNHWRLLEVNNRGKQGGSESRGQMIARLIVENLHRGNNRERILVKP